MADTTLIYKRTPEVVSANLEDKSFLLHVNDWVYLELNETGSRIWSLLENGKTVDTLTSELIQEFDIEPAACATDTAEFLAMLEEKHFVTTN
jgi:hypothetical protein